MDENSTIEMKLNLAWWEILLGDPQVVRGLFVLIAKIVFEFTYVAFVDVNFKGKPLNGISVLNRPTENLCCVYTHAT